MRRGTPLAAPSARSVTAAHPAPRPNPGNKRTDRNPPRQQRPPQRGVSGGSAPGAEMTSAPGSRVPRTEGTQALVGMGGVEPPRPFGHTDLNRARLPFRHIPMRRSRPAELAAEAPWDLLLVTGRDRLRCHPSQQRADTACDAEKTSTASRAAIRGSEVPATASQRCASGRRIPSCPRNPRRSR